MIFVDTGPLLARYLARDQHHQRAREGWLELRRTGLPCATSSFVLDEWVTLLGRRAGSSFAADRAAALWRSEALTVWRPEESDELRAIELLARFADQRVSFTDCVSFALMRRHRARMSFTFDRHFATAGFTIWPEA